ncbi:cobalamin-binding protein [Gloeocapsa sp. PCC 73106]|uniref:cobalamin-binding protein n=1 Tax=Gloeocapsa sp. PCC 73106 TaxID=102232 RepID=UPI001EE63CF8|nr:cobalamin-binding protein [Gloeocapsa sp. PCC 73106]
MSRGTSLKIVTLLPSATEIVASLGLIESLVGRSHECDYPPGVEDLPVCTRAKINSDRSSYQIDTDVKALFNNALSIYDLDIETLKQLQPTHIITQDQCELCAVSFSLVESAVKELLPSQPQVISLQPDTLSQVWQDIQRVGKALSINAQPTLNSLKARVEVISSYSQSLPSSQIPQVLALEWIDPLMVGGNWIPELIELAGGKPLFAQTGQPSRYLNWQEVEDNQPDIIVVMPCGFNLERNLVEIEVLKPNPAWQNLVAVQQNRVFLVDGNAYFNRPGPRLVDSLEILAQIFHPERFNFDLPHPLNKNGVHADKIKRLLF